MAKKPQLAKCYVHGGNSVDTRLLHEHHKHPEGYGGEDTPENRIWLCASCHDILHRIAQMVLKNKGGVAGQITTFTTVTGTAWGKSANERGTIYGSSTVSGDLKGTTSLSATVHTASFLWYPILQAKSRSTVTVSTFTTVTGVCLNKGSIVGSV